jgi:hypothetical protein
VSERGGYAVDDNFGGGGGTVEEERKEIAGSPIAMKSAREAMTLAYVSGCAGAPTWLLPEVDGLLAPESAAMART